jgi:glutathione synthase/RimK-type ligase-like ATP-grasp enzyme
VNNIQSDVAAEYKPYQLKVAKELGFNLPRTLITNNPLEVVNFWEQENRSVVYKAFNQRGLVWRPTRPLNKHDMDKLSSVSYAPVIFQAFIPGIYDIRVSVVGNDIFATEFNIPNLESVDYRVNMVDLPCRPHTIPDSLEKQIRTLMRTLKLEFSGIDFRLTPDGEYVFFEVNTAGEFMYLQNRTQQPISQSLAAHLASGKAANSS